MYPAGSALARIYGTPKMHNVSSSETFPKLFEIISIIVTFNYDLADFLCDRLSPAVPDNCSCKDTFSFVSKIKNANLSSKFLVSCSVTSCFINIPLQEPIDIEINVIFSYNPNLNSTKKELKKKNSIFLYHGLISFKQ